MEKTVPEDTITHDLTIRCSQPSPLQIAANRRNALKSTGPGVAQTLCCDVCDLQ